MYAEIALNVPVRRTFHYHIPAELENQAQPGQLVQVAFGTAQQHGIILRLLPSAGIPQTKPITALLDKRPVLNDEQMALAHWMSMAYLTPIGACLWLFLPPGITGKRDLLVALLDEHAPARDPVEAQVIALLKRRGPLRGQQLNLALPGRDWRSAVDALAKAGAVLKESTLAPPRARPKIIRTAALAIHPNQIMPVARHLGRASRQADILEVLGALPDDSPPVDQVLAMAEASRAPLNQLAKDGLVLLHERSARDQPQTVSLSIPREAVDETLIALRKGEKYLHILRVLARENTAIDVSWLYAQTDAKLADLKRLEEEGLVILSEEEAWRDSLAERDFVPSVAPALTPEQQAAWAVIEARIRAWDWGHMTDPLLTSPASGGGTDQPSPAHLSGGGTGQPSPAHLSGGGTGQPSPAHLSGGGTDQPSPAHLSGGGTDPLLTSPASGGGTDPLLTSPASGGGTDKPDSAPSPLTGRAGEGFQRETWSYWRTPPHLWRRISPLAKEMRHAPTQAEDHLWQRIRRHQLGVPFRRQHIIDRFVVDFFCPDASLVVEVDGPIHQYTTEEDALRQEFLESMGLLVLRYTNEQVMTRLDDVLAMIQAAVDARRSDASAADPLLTSPASGGGTGKPDSAPSPLTGRAGEGFQPAGPNIFLLHGVTGSGKTEIYLRATELTLAQGRQVIFLVPEIALTAQTIRRVASRFPGRLAVVHSTLSDGERYDTWRRARDGVIDIVVGARSALFTPFPDVGLIIIDEEHDHSYKQGAGMSQPYYHARQVAEEIARRNDALLILGSATPDLESVFRSRRGDFTLLRLPNRIMGHRSRILELSEREGVVARYYPASAEDALTIDLPPVQVVDMRDELKSGNTGMFSQALQTGLGDALARGEQAMLFLNRRGMNTFVFCRDCGYVDMCPRCDVPLTYHRYDERMRCHLCGHIAPARRVCPECGSVRIKFFGAGTQHVEQELRRQFPQARVLRWDADTARTPRAHEELLQAFIDRRADVLIGTQMVAKGLDLPLVTLVGVVNADVGLGLPDFRAGERTFQLLTQVAGRAGRGLLGGQAIFQTYQPEHYVIEAAAGHDYDGFYEQEIDHRRALGYPPFRRLARVVIQMQNESKARAEAERAARLLRDRVERRRLTGTEFIGPAPCFFAKINYVYRWHLLVRSPDPTQVFDGLDIPRSWYVDIDPVDVL